MKTVFIRAIEAPVDQKSELVLAGVRGSRNVRFEADVTTFGSIPSSPFAYWVDDSLRQLFDEFPKFESDDRTATRGASTCDDFRYVRLWFETPVRRAKHLAWPPFTKGGRFARYYADIPTVVDWDEERSTFRGFIGRPGRWQERPEAVDRYFLPGITWPLRGIVFSGQAVPKGSVFSVGGKVALIPEDELLAYLALFNSTCFDALIRVFAGKVGGVQYEVGLIQSLPVPAGAISNSTTLARAARAAWMLRRRLDSRIEISHAFSLPALLQDTSDSLAARAEAWNRHSAALQAKIDDESAKIDDQAFRLYGIAADERQLIEQGANAGIEEDGVTPDDDEGDGSDKDIAEVDAAPMVASLLSWTLGVAFGRFDVRLATGEREAPPEPEPFDPLPVCSPGMLTGDDGLPVAAPPPGYPLTFPPDGIFVDDPGHSRDLVRAVRAVFEAVFDDANARWHEAAELIGTPDLRTWFARDFFEPHIKRYSKSRRKAPIYWQFATASGSYSVWIYIHRATGDTLFRVLNDFVGPKLDHEKARLDSLTQEAGATPSAAQRREIEQQETFVGELQALKTEVARVAPLWRPNLDDGVLLNFAPLWRLVPQNRSWQGECRSAWEKLQSGDYDWAHLAMHLWPERVVPRCMEDRSLAIAHGLEDVFWVEDEERWRPRNPPDQEEKLLIRRYQREEIKELHSALSAVCQSHADVPASELWRLLEGKELDTTPLARLLWPRRIAERCLEDEAFAAAHNLSPPERGASARMREKWLKTYEVSMWSHLKTHVGAALRAAPGSAGQAWEALASGQLDEQPLALRLWAARVVSKARTDLPLAQHQGMERYFWCQEPGGGWRSCRSPQEEMSRAIQSRTSTTVKAALRELLSATVPTTAAGRKARRRGSSPPSITPKPAPAAARAPAPDTAVDEATLRAVKAAIASVADGASKADVLAATGLSDSDWNKAIAALLDRGDVTRTGQKRGTRYHAGGESNA